MKQDAVNGSQSLHKSNTRKRIMDLRRANAFLTMIEIAKRVNVSRQYVYQILKKEGLPTKHLIKKCLYTCPVCGSISEFKFCSLECKKKWQQIQIVCTRCGILFTRDKRQFFTNYRRHSDALFCTKDCASKWFGEQYGFKRFPNHMASANRRITNV